MSDETALRVLPTLFTDLFGPDELTRFVAQLDADVQDSLPANGSAATRAFVAAEALLARGLVAPPLWEALTTERPGRAADIALARIQVSRGDAGVRRLGPFVLGRPKRSSKSGTLYTATQGDRETRFVVRELPPPDTAFGQRMLAHARRAIRHQDRFADHPHVQRVAVFEPDARPRPYYAMPWAGTTLHEYVGAPCARASALRWVRELCAALTAVHGEGLVHRNVKPSNVDLVQGRAVLSDFKHALPADGTDDDAMWIHQRGWTYFAPELRRHPASAHPSMDIYAAGGVLYTLLTGKLPVDLHDPGDQLEGLEPELAAVIGRACHAVQAERFGSAADLADALPEPAPPTAPGER